MITKQQALEFLYELSKTYILTIDLPVRTFKVTHKDGTFHGCSYGQDLETMIRNFIDVYIRIKKVVKVNFPVPVDIDMLEVGQTYRLGTGETLYLKDITEYKLIFTHTKNNIIFGIDKEDIREIYKVVE